MLETAEPKDQATKSGATLYVNNINEKIALNKIKYVLTKIFGRYGIVEGITAHTNLKMKGQAFVTYRDVLSCEKAILKLQGRPVFKKPIRVTYAKKPSDHERSLNGDSEGISRRIEMKKAKAEAEEKAKAQNPGTQTATSQISKAQEKQWKLLPPHSVLLLQNVHETRLQVDFLQEKFGAFAGFLKIRLIKFRNLAFVDFDLESAATACLEKIDHGQFGDLALLSYAKK